MSVAGRQQASARITVTQEKNAPVKPGKLTFNAVHAAFGNGYAHAAANAPKSQKLTTPGVTITQEKNAPVTKPGKLTFDASQAVFGETYNEPATPARSGEAASVKFTSGSGTNETDLAGRQAGGAASQPHAATKTAATIGADGALVFDADAVKDKIVGTVPDLQTQVAADDPLSALAPDAASETTPTAKADDVGAKATKAMTKPADATMAAGETEAEEKSVEPPAGQGESQFPLDEDQPAPVRATGDETPAVEQDAGGGGTGGTDLAAWKSRVSGVIAATPKPTLGNDADSSITVISATGKAAGARYRGGVGGAAKDIRKAVRPPPPTPAPLPPLPQTIEPKADAQIDQASNKKLPDQELPPLNPWPLDVTTELVGTDLAGGNVPAALQKLKELATPELDPVMGGDLGTTLALSEPEKPAGKDAPDAKARKKLAEAKAKEPEARKGKPGQKMVLQDIAPPITPRPERGTKGQSKETFRLVIGELLRGEGPETEAVAITNEARDEAYPSKALSHEYKDMGKDWKDPIKAELEAQVKAIADMAGIADKELAGAVADREAQLAALKAGEHGAIGKAGEDAKADTKAGGEEAQKVIGGERQAKDEATLQTLIAANGETDPQVIQMRRDMGVQQLTQTAARQDLNYEKAGDRRARALGASFAKYQTAYETAGRANEKKIYDSIRAEQLKGKKPDKGKKTEAEKKALDEADRVDQKAADEAALGKTKRQWEWIRGEVERLKIEFGKLKDAAAKATTSYRDEIKAALQRAKTLLNDWADRQLEAHESWWDSLMREFSQWAKDAQNDSAAWEEARNEQLRDAVAGDLQLVADLEAAMRQRVDMKAFIQERGLDQAQLKVVQKFFTPVDPGGKQLDSIGAVAEGMRARVRTNRKPGMIDRFKTEVMAQPKEDWFKLAYIGQLEHPPFEVGQLSTKLFQAMDQWGTEEKDIFAALANLTPLQAKALRAHYAIFHSPKRDGRSLDEDLAYEMGGEELDRAKAQLAGDQALADAAALAEAFWGPGTDEATVMSVLRNKTPEQQDAIRAAYKRQYHRDLDADLKSELTDPFSSDHDLDRAKALQSGNVGLADAIGIEAAMHGGMFGAGTEEGEITAIYEQNRREVEEEAAQKGWTTAEIDAEVKKRNGKIDEAYEAKYPNALARAQGKSSLVAAMEDEMSDSELDLGKALRDADLTQIDAAKLGVEKKSLWASDETINKVLESQGQRAKRDVERDANVDMSRRAQIDDLRGKPWGRERWTQEREKTKTFIGSETKKRALENMAALETSYNAKFGKDGLVNLIVYNTMGEDGEKAVDLYLQGGTLEPEQEIYYACNGIGTDLDKLKEVLKGKSKEDIDKIRKAWVKRYGGTEADFDARIMEEVSGRDAKDMEWALKGEPQTIDEKIARARERRNYENSAYGEFGSQEAEKAAIDGELANLEQEAANLKKLEAEAPAISDREFDALNAPKGEKETEPAYAARMKRLDAQLQREAKLDYYQGRFRSRESSFDTMIEDHRKAVDAFADTAATIAGIVATVLVMIVVVVATVASGGTAGVAFAALASAQVAAAAAIAGAVATIGAKYAIKGSAYTHQEMAVDAVVGAIDAVVSAATAGVGGGLLKAAKAGAPTSRLAAWAAKSRLASGLSKMAKSERLVARVFAGAVAEGMEGVVQTMPSALAGNVLDEKNWVHGNLLANIAQGTLMQTAIGGVASAGMPILLDGVTKVVGGVVKGGIGAAKGIRSGWRALTGGLGDNIPTGSLARETGDVLARRGDAIDRLALWKQFQADHPGAPFKQFSEQLDAGIIAGDVDDAARHALQREMRGELLGGIPPSQRQQFAEVPIAVLSDADFARFTKSASGQAVVIFKDGKPLVLLREGADFKALREEGIHLLQSKDPKLSKAFQSLDESNLARWNQMGLDEQLALYKTKIDIELDAQAQLIRQLDDELAAATDPATRNALQAQRRAAGETFENLAKRLDELADISPLDRLKMARGEVVKPQYLDQEPRLFTKKPSFDNDPGVIAAKARFASAGKRADDILGKISDPETRNLFEQIVEKLRTTKSDQFGKAKKIMQDGKKVFADIYGSSTDAAARFDITIGFDRFVDTVESLNVKGSEQKLKSMMEEILTLGAAKKVPFGEIDPFMPLLARVDNPKLLLETAGAVAQLDNFRNKELVNLAHLMGEAANHGPEKLSVFLTKLKDVAEKAESRDLIKRSADSAGWAAAHTRLKAAVQDMKNAFPGGASNHHLLNLAGEEFEKARAFSFTKFKASMLASNPLGDPKKSPLSKILIDLADDFKAKGIIWKPDDIGVLMVWDNVVTKLHSEIGGTSDGLAKAAAFLMAIDCRLGKELKTELKQGGYDRFRYVLQNAAVDHLLETGTAKQKFERFGVFMDFFRHDKASDAASIGEYYADLQREIFGNPSHATMKGELAAAVGFDMPSRKLDGIPQTRMVDGAIKFNAEQTVNGTKLKKGLYTTESKAGVSKNMEQASLVHNLLVEGKLRTVGSELAQGHVIQTESILRAKSQVTSLDNMLGANGKRGLHKDIIVTYIAEDGTTKIFPRTQFGASEIVGGAGKLPRKGKK